MQAEHHRHLLIVRGLLDGKIADCSGILTVRKRDGQNFEMREGRDYVEPWLERRVLKRRLSMPNLAIFDSRVWCGIPSFAAAPSGPETRPWHSAKAASIVFLSRSTSSFLSSARMPVWENR